MKAQEKELIYNLLKTADAYNSGYTRANFLQNFEFLDDDEGSISEEVANSSTSVIPIPQENKNEKAGLSLDELSAKILRCTRCGLARTRNNVVPGEGVSSPLVLVIGEGPGYDEDMQGRPFVGKAGVLLDKMLAAINLDRKTNAYIANIVKCRPPENRNPFPDEQSACFLSLKLKFIF